MKKVLIFGGQLPDTLEHDEPTPCKALAMNSTA